MPPKKSAAVQKAAGDGGPVLPEGSDPVQTAVAIIDKKVRNLEKRKVLLCMRRYHCGDQSFMLGGGGGRGKTTFPR